MLVGDDRGESGGDATVAVALVGDEHAAVFFTRGGLACPNTKVRGR